MNVLSIDFDFFVDCHDLILVGDQYDPSGVEHWRRRKKEGLKQKFTGPEPSEFLKHFDLSRVPDFAPSESHREIVALLTGKKNLHIFNVDAHHDLAYSALDLLDINRGDYTCGSWGLYLICSAFRVKSWTQIYPDWRDKHPEVNWDKFVKSEKFVPAICALEKKKLSEIVEPIKIDFLFLCRSSAWVDPEHDDKFTELCHAIGKIGHFQIPKDIRWPRKNEAPGPWRQARQMGWSI